MVGVCGLDLSGSEEMALLTACSCEQSNDPSGPAKWGNFFDWLSIIRFRSVEFSYYGVAYRMNVY